MVTITADIAPEELQVFLEDTDEHLQLLDEDIIKLENDDNDELLQEIFRAAHTMKDSKLTLKLPLTLTTIHGRLVTSRGVTFAIPLLFVSETLRIDRSETKSVTQKEVTRIRDKIVPLLNMDEVLSMRTEKSGHNGIYCCSQNRGQDVRTGSGFTC